MVAAAEAFHEGTLTGQVGGVAAGEPVVTGDVDGEELRAPASRRDPGRPADQGVTLGPSGEGDDDPLTGLPGGGDAVVPAVPVELVVDLVGDPQQRELAQSGEVAQPEVVAERGVDLLGGVHVAVGEPATQGLGRHVDELDLVGLPDDPVGHGLALDDAGDGLDDVVQGLEVLHVDRRDHSETGFEQLLDVLPALGVARPRGVRVGEFVHEDHLGPAGEDGVDVHLGQGGAAVRHGGAGHHLEALEERRRVRATVRLDVPDDDVRAALEPPPGLLEHRVGLAHAGRGAQVDPQQAPAHVVSLRRQPRYG